MVKLLSRGIPSDLAESMRLDRLLVVLGEFDSRQKAQEAIKAGKVAINNTIVQKPAYEINETLAAKILESARESNNANALALGLESKLDSNMPRITIIDRGFVSRAGEKLQGFLEMRYPQAGRARLM